MKIQIITRRFDISFTYIYIDFDMWHLAQHLLHALQTILRQMRLITLSNVKLN